MAAKKVVVKVFPSTRLYLWFPLPVSQMTTRGMARLASKMILRDHGLLLAWPYLNAWTGIPGIAVLRKAWKIANRTESKAVLLYEGYHILLGHPYRRISNEKAEKEVAAFMPSWALQAIDSLTKKLERLYLKMN